jgi:hypothetical protein
MDPDGITTHQGELSGRWRRTSYREIALETLMQETYCPVVESGHSALRQGGVAAVLGAAGWIVGRRLLQRD